MAEDTPVNSFVIEVLWDDDAEVWVAESDGVPGLIAEADSRTHLIEKLAVLILRRAVGGLRRYENP